MPKKSPKRVERRVTAADVQSLSLEAQPFFIEVGRITESAIVTIAETKAALLKNEYVTHQSALDFDKAFGGLRSETYDDDEGSPDQFIVLGIHACVEGWQRDAFIQFSPRKDEPRAQKYTPIGVMFGGAEMSVYMDETGAVHLYGFIQGEWFEGAKDGVSFLDSFASDYGRKPKVVKAAKTAKATKPKGKK